MKFSKLNCVIILIISAFLTLNSCSEDEKSPCAPNYETLGYFYPNLIKIEDTLSIVIKYAKDIDFSNIDSLNDIKVWIRNESTGEHPIDTVDIISIRFQPNISIGYVNRNSYYVYELVERKINFFQIKVPKIENGLYSLYFLINNKVFTIPDYFAIN